MEWKCYIKGEVLMPKHYKKYKKGTKEYKKAYKQHKKRKK